MTTENITRHDGMELAQAMDSIALRVGKDESATFTLDLHPEGAFRARFTNNRCMVYAVRITMDNAIIALADELDERGI